MSMFKQNKLSTNLNDMKTTTDEIAFKQIVNIALGLFNKSFREICNIKNVVQYHTRENKQDKIVMEIRYASATINCVFNSFLHCEYVIIFPDTPIIGGHPHDISGWHMNLIHNRDKEGVHYLKIMKHFQAEKNTRTETYRLSASESS